jgi:hypothetical protein
LAGSGFERAGSNRSKKSGSLALWWARCDCDQEIVVAGAHLRRGSTRSCGCLRRKIGIGRL